MKRLAAVALIVIMVSFPVYTTGEMPATPTDIGPMYEHQKVEQLSPSMDVPEERPMDTTPVRHPEREESPPIQQEAPPFLQETTQDISEEITREPEITPVPVSKPVAKKKVFVVQLFDAEMKPLSIKINTDKVGEYGALIWVEELGCFISVKKEGV